MVLQVSLLGIYREFHVPAGGRMSVPNLELGWRRTGLRDADLPEAVDICVREGFIEPIRVDGSLALRLTDTGSAALSMDSSLNNLLERVLTRRTLAKARKRIPAGRHNGDDRRQEEQ